MFDELKQYDNVIKIFASSPLQKDCKFLRIKIQSLDGKSGRVFCATQFTATQAFHVNVKPRELYDWAENNMVGKYKQVLIVTREREITYLSNAKRTKRLCRDVIYTSPVSSTANRNKNYLLNEGDDIPVFQELGIFTTQRKVVNSMYAKFKQINRFVEILDDVFKDYGKKELTLLDFGCGKSYLTFVIYHYLVHVRKINAKIIGYDLKTDVVAECNALAEKYGYGNLRFVVADVSKDRLYDEQIDAVVSLHACDVATDYALNYAVSHNVPYIFSVPCCQHEINSSVKNGGDLDVLLKYGIIKERVSALLTDSIRAMLLEDEGYSVDVMEFVDIAHSPKNLMIRAVKTHGKRNVNAPKIAELMQKYGFDQKLFELLNK